MFCDGTTEQSRSVLPAKVLLARQSPVHPDFNYAFNCGLVGLCLVIFGYRLFHKGFESVLKTHGGNLRLCPATQVVWGEAIENWVHHIFHSCLPVSDHVDVVLMSCQLKPSTPQSRSIPWRRLMKFKYMIYHISPTKMAHGSHATKGARAAINLVCYATQNHIGMGTRSSQFWRPCFSLTMSLLKRGTPQHQENACTSHSGCTKTPSCDARDLPACMPTYPFKKNTTVPSRIRI